MNLKEVIILTAAYYRQQIPDAVIAMYAEDLSDLPTEQVQSAYLQYRRNPKNKTFPLPAVIREIVNPEEYIPPEVLAREAAARICGAVVSCGWNNGAAAEQEIGPEGWAVVLRMGGWTYLCENLGLVINPTTFQAQCRDQLIGDFQFGTRAISERLQLGASQRGEGGLERIGFTKLLTPTSAKKAGAL